MTSSSSAQDNIITSQSDRAGSSSAARTGLPLTAAAAKSSARSYATAATQRVLSPPSVVSSSNASSTLEESKQHGTELLNSKKMAAPAIVNSGGMANGTSAALDHTRKPSVTISAAGASGYTPNGGPISANTRPNISFGSINAAGTSPSIANSLPMQAQNSPLQAPQVDPRITSPSKSPSPIPRPTNSGGRPPTNFQNQGNGGLSFGSMGGLESDVNRPMPGPGGSNLPGPVHLNRQPSQNAHVEINNASNMGYGPGPNRNNIMPGAGRGRGPSYGQGYQQQPPYSSPSTNYRQVQRAGSNTLPPHFQNQGPLGPNPNSPHMQPRTPGLQGSHPGTPQMQHMAMNPNQMHFQPSFQNYASHLSSQPGHFSMPQPYDASYGGYYTTPYAMSPAYLQPQGSPSSPRPPRPGGQPSQYIQGQYNQPPTQSMSRSASQVSERPPSASVNIGQQPAPPVAPQIVSQPSQASNQSAPAPSQSSNFTIPPKVKKGLVIKRPDGEIVTFDKPSTGAAPVAPPSPAPASIAPTPPPRSLSTTSRTPPDNKPGKTAAEIKAEFLEQVKKGSQEDRAKDDQDAADAKAKQEADEKAVKDKEATEAKLLADEQEAKAKAAKEQQEAEQKAIAEKEAAEKEAADKAEAEKAAAEKAEADRIAAEQDAAEKAKAVAEKEEAERLEAATAEAERANAEKAASEKAEAEKAEAERIEAEKAAAVKADEAANAEKVKADRDEEQRLKDEEFERMIAEMEAAEKAEEEREKAFSDKKRKAAEIKAAEEKEAAAKEDERLKQAERDAEALEEARQNKKADEEVSTESKEEDEKLFASLKKPTLGPGADADDDDDDTPSGGLEDSKYATNNQKSASTPKPKPAALKLDTARPVEPAQATPGMQALKSARMLQLQNESINYPEGIKSPNPAIVQGGRRAGRLYDKDFLLQFRDAFKEKPSVDWDTKLKESVGDPSDTANPRSARTPAGMPPRGSSGRPAPQSAFQGMGTFGLNSGRTLPANTTSQERFQNSIGRGQTMNNPLAQFAQRGGAFPMGSVSMPGRQTSMGGMSSTKQNSTRSGGRNPSARNDRPNKKEEAKMNSAMPMTAGVEIKSLEVSSSGWKGFSVGRPGVSSETLPSGHLAPDLVQRKVKAALNKMTPERFDKIADQILVIAAQSKDEADGRTLRQVIQLTFDKACDEAHWASMYAKFSLRMMNEMSPEIKDETITDKNANPVVGGPLFRKYLLNRCQEEFERGWTVNMPERKPGETEEAAMLSDEYYTAAAAKRKGLGLVQFIGELYKLRMLSIKIMHECFLRLLNFEGMPDESAIESLVKLLRTVGSTMQQEANGPGLLDTYFQRIETIMNMEALPSRMHFMLLDTLDLRKAGWHSKDDAKGPKTIQEIHQEAAVAAQQAEQARVQQNQRGGGGRMPAGRGDARNFSGQMPAPDYPRNQVASDDLRRLNNRRQPSSQGPAKSLGPSSIFSSRSNSGRPSALGPPVNTSTAKSSDSGMTSRTASRNDEGPRTPSNAFSLLENLDASGENIGEADASPVSPTPAKALPAETSTESATTVAETGDDDAAGSS